ncbi:MAG: carbamoyltransferase HypF, partial [Endomicrobiales bacterium]
PLDRRFHAQPDACPVCGPKVSLLSGGFKRLASGQEALLKTVNLLRKGKILAVKSLGGYHLACDAANEAAVGRLRKKKERPHKPLALMLPDIESVRSLCLVTQAEENMLLSAARPIVLLRKGPDIERALSTAGVLAPGNAFLGVMLPYTPLHYLLFSRECAGGKVPFRALVMTSGNRSDEPICITEQDARKKLSGIADLFLTHDRPIHNRMDDSIVQEALGGEQGFTMVRRSRGYVPEPVELPAFAGNPRIPSVLAVGAELKNTFCLTRRDKAYVSPYIGDLDNSDSLGFFKESAERFTRFLKVEPALVAHDLHPDYLSTVFARSLLASRRVKGVAVQHHHAHIASVLAENNMDKPVIGFAFDGTGYGADGAVWGGECLLVRGAEFKRLAHLNYFPLPGGDAASREIWRLAVALLDASGIDELPKEIRKKFPYKDIRSLMRRKINCPESSSLGRLFDAVAAITGIAGEVTFEAQAAITL